MSDFSDDVAAALDQVVELGSPPQQAALGAAVSDHISARPTIRRPADPETVTALRNLANETRALVPGPEVPEQFSPLSIMVDFNALYEDLKEPLVWEVLGKLKDLFSGG